MTQLKFYKVDGIAATGLVVGGIYFDKKTGIIHVATGETTTDQFGVGGVKDASLKDGVLTINKYDGTDVTVDFNDIASATSVASALNLKADKTQVAADIATATTDMATNAGVSSAIAAAQAADKEAWEAAIAAKNVDASGDSLVSASAEDNKVTVTATTALTEAVGKANSAVQSVVEGDNNGEIKVDGTAVKVHGLGSAAFTNVDAYDAAGTATAAVAAITGTLASNDSKTLETINDELDAIDGEIQSLKTSVAGGVHFGGVFEEQPEPTEYENGTLIIVGEQEFINVVSTEDPGDGSDPFEAHNWVLLGDLTPADQRLSAIEASYVKSVATTDGTYVKLTPDAAAKNEVVITIDDTVLANKLGEIEDAIDAAVAGSVASIGGQTGAITLAAPAGDGEIVLSIGEDKQLKATINNLENVISDHVESRLTYDPLNVGEGEDDYWLVSAKGVKTAIADAKAYTDNALTWVTFE